MSVVVVTEVMHVLHCDCNTLAHLFVYLFICLLVCLFACLFVFADMWNP